MAGACADIGERKPDAHEEPGELFSSNSELPPEYRKELVSWMHSTLFKDPRVVAQMNEFLAAVRTGKSFVHPGIVSFSTEDSLPMSIDGGDERLDFMLNSNFRFGEDVGSVTLTEGEIVVRCDVMVNDVGKFHLYRENGISLGKYGSVLVLTFVYNTHEGSVRKFPKGDLAEDFLKLFSPVRE